MGGRRKSGSFGNKASNCQDSKNPCRGLFSSSLGTCGFRVIFSACIARLKARFSAAVSRLISAFVAPSSWRFTERLHVRRGDFLRFPSPKERAKMFFYSYPGFPQRLFPVDLVISEEPGGQVVKGKSFGFGTSLAPLRNLPHFGLQDPAGFGPGFGLGRLPHLLAVDVVGNPPGPPALIDTA